MRKSDRNQIRTITNFRSRDRFFRQNDQWYFQTREGARGPFENRVIAERELGRFIETLGFVEQNEKHLPSGRDWKNVTVVDMDAHLMRRRIQTTAKVMG